MEELREANEQLRLEVGIRKRAEGDLRLSRQRITNTEEAVRKDIAELLHGRVQTSLLVAWHRLNQCESLLDSDPGEARQLLAEIRDEVGQIRERDVREASHLLHPSIIRVGLMPALRSLVSPFEEELSVDLNASEELLELDDPVENRIPENIRLVAYRVLQEGLNNVRRHAHATSAEVNLVIVPDGHLEISLKDNGGGFDTSRLELGLGLNAIADRVGVAGGTWNLASVVGQGTELMVSLPFEKLKRGIATQVAPGQGGRIAT